jgi:hypothetical protein
MLASHSENFVFSSAVYNHKNEIYKPTIFPVVCMGVKIGLSHESY